MGPEPEPNKSTVMLTYGGAPDTMGKSGSFDVAQNWFGFKKCLLEMDTTKEVFEAMREESLCMIAAAQKTFPIPQLKIGTPSGSVIDEIKRLDADMQGKEKAAEITNCMKRNQQCCSFESGGEHYYCFGPFSTRQDLMNGLKADPMLQPVFQKWSQFEAEALDKVFEFGNLYLQIKWQGWYVRSVLEMNEAQLDKLLQSAGSVTEALPDGWERRYSILTHAPYYFDNATGKRQWRRPKQIADSIE